MHYKHQPEDYAREVDAFLKQLNLKKARSLHWSRTGINKSTTILNLLNGENLVYSVLNVVNIV